MRLVLTAHSIDEWCVVRAQQARRLGCSNAYVRRLIADLRASYAER